MDDVRWFAPNRYCTLIVPRLRDRGLSIALDGDGPARLAIAMDAQVAAAAYSFAARHRSVLIHYVWDLPPWRLGRGRPDWVGHVFGRFVRVPRVGRRYAERPGYYSRLRFVANHAREVWVPSAHTAASVQERLGVSCRQVPFCFDSERFTPAPATRRRGLLTVSHLTPHKNQAAVIRAAARLEPKTTVRIIGRGPERASLERLAATLGVACSIESDLTETDMVTAYRTAEVVVCPSTFEGFGLTPMEAIATATPAVASDIPPHREFLGASPHFFTLDDDDGLVTAIGASPAGPPPSPDVLAGVTLDAAAERGDGRPIPFLDHFGQVIEVEGRDVLDAWVDIVDRRRGPLAQSQLEDGLHRDLRRPREHRREAFVLRVRAQGVRRGHVHGDDHVGAEDARRAHRQVVHRGAVHVEPPADLAGGEVPRQRAGGEHGVLHRHLVEPVESPEDLHAGVQVHGVDDQTVAQVLEGDVADEAVQQGVERLAAEQGGGAHPLERHVGVRHREDILAHEADGDFMQLGDALPRGPGGAHQRAHARPDDLRRHEPTLGQCLQHADVGDAFHAPAAQHEGELGLIVHVTRRLPGR